jgi:hypothetical protein
VVAPVRHRIELQAVRELHLVGFAKLLELLPSLPGAPALLRSLGCWVCALGEVVELKSLGVLDAAKAGGGVQGGRLCGGEAQRSAGG